MDTTGSEKQWGQGQVEPHEPRGAALVPVLAPEELQQACQMHEKEVLLSKRVAENPREH